MKEPKTPGPPLLGLRERRVFRRISQVEMASILGCGQSHYRMFETGQVRLDLHRAKKLADRLECTLDDLL